MRFTKKDIIKLLENYGRAFYNPVMSSKSKLNFLKIIKAESFPLATIDELGEKFDFLYKKYQSFKAGTDKKFEYFQIVDKAVKLALLDYMPNDDEIEVLTDDDYDDDDYIPETPIVEKPKVHTEKRRHDEDMQSDAKKTKLDTSHETADVDNIPIIPQNEIQCVKIDDSILRDIELNVTNAVVESLKKHDEAKTQSLDDSFQTMKSELRSIIQNGTSEIVQSMQKKEKDLRLSDVYVMVKTLLDEQREANEALKEIKTMIKTSIGAQKVQYDVDLKRCELEKNNESLLKQVLSIIKEKDDNNNNNNKERPMK